MVVMQDEPLGTFIEQRDAYLDASLRLEGRGRWGTLCARCGVKEPKWRCKDCFGPSLWCHDCVEVLHEEAPLHRILVHSLVFTISLTADLISSIGLGPILLREQWRIWTFPFNSVI
jgi:hypothetical protein